MTEAPISTSDLGESLPDDVSTLQRELMALRKTNAVLKKRVADAFSERSSTFAHFERQAHMERLIEERTAEIISQAELVHEENRRRARVEALLNDALRLAKAGGWMFDLASESMHLTDEFCRILEIDPATSLSLDQSIEFFHDECRVRVESALTEALGSQKPFDLEGRLRTAKGNERWVRAQARVYTEEGRASRILGLLSDITDQKMVELRMTQAQKMESVGQLASGIAHEINTPTQFVSDNVQFLKGAFADVRSLIATLVEIGESVGDNAIASRIEESLSAADFEYIEREVPQAIEQAMEGLCRVARLVSAMKDYAHPGSEQRECANINRAIESAVTVARNEWKYVAVIQFDLDRELPGVPCFLADFNQVVLNMIVNAAHAIEERHGRAEMPAGEIRVATRRIEGEVCVSISDNGAGIPERLRKKIFDPFFTTKEVGKGTGQGLSISHQVIVERHHGRIELETEVGKGTTFHLYLPMLTEAQ